MKYTSSLKLKLIYVFRINDRTHNGCLKIGEASVDNENISGLEPNCKILNNAAKNRINQYTQTAGIKYDLVYTELSIYNDKGLLKAFSDSEVHQVLIRSGIKRKNFDSINKANEWFEVDLETVKNAITAVKEGRESLGSDKKSKDKNPIIFRPEQKEAIDKTIRQFKKTNRMLWYAKMRFGKTIAALQVVKELNFSRTLILTHRPVVDVGWFEDFGKIFYDKQNFIYGSKNNGDSIQTLEKQNKLKNFKYIYFASMQDLRGSAQVGGNFNKNDEVFGANWDCIIVDEAHEGTQTDLGKNVLNELVKSNTKILELSGTPFNLYGNYKVEEIFTWDYIMEQRAKSDWDKIHLGDSNPYASLPRLNIFTYNLSELLNEFVDVDVAFNFREFFKVDINGNFIHEKDISSFLNLLCKEDKNNHYPYSKKEYRDNFRHTLWMVPGVKQAKALSNLLQKHSVFSQFKIVNVAGNGNDEEENDEALKKVQKAITNMPHETYSITLSCGRLTTGVTVPAWTAVFMLSGSYNTSAASYMQTIYRVQSPANINGRIKEECFVFDFAPDRTLKVIAFTANISSKVGKTTNSDREIMREFLNFCPIISVDGSRMENFNAEVLLEQLKKVYVERVIGNGFEDGYLYDNDKLMQLGKIELKEFENLKGIIGTTKAMPKTDAIDINKLGFTNEQYELLEIAEKKNRSKKILSENEKRLLKEKEENRKNRKSAISILRGISIRMPLMLYGANVKDEDKEINIDNFTELIDEQSWKEFMPKNVTKEIFRNFKKYYEPDVFRAAGKRIRAMARACDNLSVEDRISRITKIFSTFRNPDKETVLTPWRVVNMHLGDCLGGYVFYDEKMINTLENPRFVNFKNVTENVFSENSKILEINSKSGLYPLYMAYGIYKNILNIKRTKTNKIESIEENLTIWDKVVAENIFIICKTPMAKSITKRTLVGFRNAKVNTRYFEDLINQISNKQQNFLEKIKQGNTYWKTNNGDNMKFNAIVGNPPYQVNDGSGASDDAANPVYQNFFKIAKLATPDYFTLIMPSKWMVGGKIVLKRFRKEMMEEINIREFYDYEDSSECFKNQNIDGGICYFLWDKKHRGELTYFYKPKNSMGFKLKRFLAEVNSDIVIRDQRRKSIIEKIIGFSDPFKNIVSETQPFGIRKDLFNNPARYPKSKLQFKEFNNSVKIYGVKGIKGGARRIVGYVSPEIITKNKDLFTKFKLYFTTSYSTNAITPPETIEGEKNSVCTETFLLIGPFNTSNEQKNCHIYIKTNFFKVLLFFGRGTMQVSQDVFRFIPLQDYTINSDVDWSKSIPEINKQLYKKYRFTQEEIGFIESMIIPME